MHFYIKLGEILPQHPDLKSKSVFRGVWEGTKLPTKITAPTANHIFTVRFFPVGLWEHPGLKVRPDLRKAMKIAIPALLLANLDFLSFQVFS